MKLTTDDLRAILAAISAALAAHRNALNTLDAALGDGDHGTGISAGFAAAIEATQASETPADLLKDAALALMNRMGGSSGALYGTLFLKASVATAGQTELTPAQFAALWQAGRDGVAQRGQAQPGDKTMIDALSPAVEALRQKLEDGAPFADALAAAAGAAEKGAAATADMQARHGRARYLGERAAGHIDPGAQSIAVMFRAIYDTLKDKTPDET